MGLGDSDLQAGNEYCPATGLAAKPTARPARPAEGEQPGAHLTYCGKVVSMLANAQTAVTKKTHGTHQPGAYWVCMRAGFAELSLTSRIVARLWFSAHAARRGCRSQVINGEWSPGRSDADATQERRMFRSAPARWSGSPSSGSR